MLLRHYWKKYEDWQREKSFLGISTYCAIAISYSTDHFACNKPAGCSVLAGMARRFCLFKLVNIHSFSWGRILDALSFTIHSFVSRTVIMTSFERFLWKFNQYAIMNLVPLQTLLISFIQKTFSVIRLSNILPCNLRYNLVTSKSADVKKFWRRKGMECLNDQRLLCILTALGLKLV